MIATDVTQDEAMQYARDNEQAAVIARKRGDMRSVRILKRTAAEWRSIAVRIAIEKK